MKRALLFLPAVTLLACTQSVEPIGTTDADLNVVRQSPTAPPLYAVRDSFWAKVGENRRLRMYYQGATPTDTGPEFLRFEVPGDALLRRPDGLIFRTGDSVLITITVIDAARFRFDFSPANLLFSQVNPARLRVRYDNSNKDFDNDGDQDQADVAIEQDLDLWYRAATGTLWFKLNAVKFEDLDEIDANVRRFSQYAVAW